MTLNDSVVVHMTEWGVFKFFVMSIAFDNEKMKVLAVSTDILSWYILVQRQTSVEEKDLIIALIDAQIKQGDCKELKE